MNSSTDNLLQGNIDELKSCDQDSPIDAHQWILGKEFKKINASLKIISCLSLMLNLIFITLLLLLWAKVTEPTRSIYGRLISEDFSDTF